MTDRRSVSFANARAPRLFGGLASAALLAVMVLAAPVAVAQTTDAPADPEVTTDPTVDPETGLSMGADVTDPDGPGTTYIAESFGEWELTCTRTGLDADPCEIYQLLQDDQGNSVAEISIISLPGGQQAAAGATIITPLETLLTTQITLRVDNAQARRYPFTFCTAMGCIARIGFTEAEVNAFKRGNQATMVIVPALAPDQQVPITISLSGFTAGYDTMARANLAAQAAAQAAEAAAQSSGAAAD